MPSNATQRIEAAISAIAAGRAVVVADHPDRENEGVLCELVNDDGTMMRGARLQAFARRHGLPYTTVPELVSYRRTQEAQSEGLRSIHAACALGAPHLRDAQPISGLWGMPVSKPTAA